MKILQINKYLYLKSGVERYTFSISSMLKNRGHEIIPFVMKHEKNIPTEYSRFFVENIDYEKEINKSIFRKLFVGFKIIYSFEAKNKLLKLISKENPDVAHIHKISNTLTPSVLYALKEKDVPVVQTLHDYRIVCPSYNMYDPNRSEICEACKGHKYFNAVKRKCQKSSYIIALNIAVESYLYHFLRTYESLIDLFISPSNFVLKKITEFGIDKNKIVHIPNYVKADEYTPKYGDSNSILYFGRLEKHKGLRTLVEAVKNIKTTKLCLVGEGTYRVDLEEYVKKNNIKNVAFLGYKPDKELRELIGKSLFTILPSEWYEPFGLTILESFASGKPVIGSDIGGIPELVHDGSTGLLFQCGNVNDLKEKINYLLNHKDLAVEMGVNARKVVEEKYNENIHYKKLINAYKKVL